MHLLELAFEGDLSAFLHRELRAARLVRRVLRENAAVKDVIESCGVPHTEVDLIVASDPRDGEQRAVGFTWIVQAPVRLVIHPVPPPDAVLPEAPRLQARGCSRFVVDGHLGKLARNLRLLGFDTVYESDADDRRLLEIMVAEDRALLTRDRRLLMHSIVSRGYCPRAPDAEAQTREVLRRFDLLRDVGRLALYQRCLRCNGFLEPVGKAEVADRLTAEPLTLLYYDTFFRCAACGQIYWSGTHFEKLAARVARLIGV